MEREKINFRRLMLDRLKVESGWRGRIGEINIGKNRWITNFPQQKSSVAIKNPKSQFYRSKIQDFSIPTASITASAHARLR
jgi:hypothetical protein